KHRSKLLEDGKGEGGCLAGARLGEAEKVPTIKKGGNRLGLNGGRMGVTRVPKGADERFGNAEIRESLFSHLKGLLSSQRLAPTTMAGALTRGLAAFQRAWNREGSELFRDQAVPRQREARTREQSPF